MARKETRLGADKLPESAFEHGLGIPKNYPLRTQSFEFVTVTGEPSDFAREENKKVVRTQAMRNFIRMRSRDDQYTTDTPSAAEGAPEQRTGAAYLESGLSSASDKSESPRKISPHKKSNKGRRKLIKLLAGKTAVPRSYTNDQYQYLHDLISRNSCYVRSLGSSHLDPFDVLPVAMDSQSGLLLDIRNSQSPTNSIAINPANDFLKYAFVDPALFHATLFLAALYSDLKKGGQHSLEYLYHGSKVFGIINNALDGGPDKLTDSILAAVAMLILKENIVLNYDGAALHTRGLCEMVRVRGGLESIQTKVLQQTVAWSDFSYSSLSGSPLRFPRLNIDRHLPYSIQVDDEPELLEPEALFGIHSSLVDTIRDVRLVSVSLGRSQTLKFTRQTASNLIYHIEYDILERHTEISRSTAGLHFLIPPLNASLQLYLFLVVRGIPDASKLIIQLVVQLRALVEACVHDLPELLVDERIWLLWISFVGTSASHPDLPERSWFVRTIVDICRVAGLETESSLREALKRVVWQDRICARLFDEMWAQAVDSWPV
ncbi:hypothetical protein PVAG01_04755 [Phlyctema vagabunda]|uniref:Tachykinin family protein n=1 Tax=Phlyctema vagabunda TaxID=108571 RepID=A0ABR4PIE7_9HELO